MTTFSFPPFPLIPNFFRMVDEPTGATLSLTQSGRVYTNAGATALCIFKLPAAEEGLMFGFFCADTDGVRITASSGGPIYLGDTVSAAPGRLDSTTIGSFVLLYCTGGLWFAMAQTGTWTASP